MKIVFKVIIVLVSQLLYHNFLIAQIKLEFQEFGISYRPKFDKEFVSLIINSGSFKGCKLNLSLEDFRGKSSFIILNRNSEIICRGNFENSRDTLSTYQINRRRGERADFPVLDITIQKYFIPIASRDWIYYQNGKEKKRQYFSHEFSN